jgi:pimeloyl-ACP methyl ester carboxylesterase
VDVGAVAPAGGEHVVVDVHLPPAGIDDRSWLWWLLPGGGMSRRYWDLDVHGYSFARHLAANGQVAVTVDHLGVGESSKPADGFALTPSVLADVNAHALAQVVQRLRSGTLADGVPAAPTLRSIGCGHSMGGLLTVHQQARHHDLDGLCLFGFGGRGLVEHLSAEELRYADDPVALRRDVGRLVRVRYRDPYPTLPRGSSDLLVGVPMPEDVHAALVASRTNLLAVAGFTSMIPGSSAPEIAAIDVPVFIGHGDRDIGAPVHDVGGEFRASCDITLYVLKESGHNHNVSPNRLRLWGRALRWAEAALRP